MYGRNRNTKQRKYQKATVLVMFALLSTVGLSLNVEGFSSYKGKIPDGGENFGCPTCHSGSSLNEFGVDFKENDKKYDDNLAAMDSDNDNFTNQEEFDASTPTNPGDPTSYPGGNTTGNNTTMPQMETSAFIGPIDMKVVVPLFFTIVTVCVIGGLVGLVISEAMVNLGMRLRNRKEKV